MPFRKSKCRTCDHTWEYSTTMSAPEPTCPECESDDTFIVIQAGQISIVGTDLVCLGADGYECAEGSAADLGFVDPWRAKRQADKQAAKTAEGEGH